MYFYSMKTYLERRQTHRRKSQLRIRGRREAKIKCMFDPIQW